MIVLSQEGTVGDNRLVEMDEALADLTARHDRVERHLSYLLHRSLAEAVLFDRYGAPLPVLRRLVFRRDGKLRRACRSWVLDRSGQPHAAWHRWMTSAAYRALPRAYQIPPGKPAVGVTIPDPSAVPSPRTARFLRLLRAAAAQPDRSGP